MLYQKLGTKRTCARANPEEDGLDNDTVEKPYHRKGPPIVDRTGCIRREAFDNFAIHALQSFCPEIGLAEVHGSSRRSFISECRQCERC